MRINLFRCAVSRRTASVFAAAALLSASAFAQTPFPTKPVRLVVPWPAGASPDVTARFIAERLTKDLGQPVLVDNRPGASQIIGTDLVAKAPADGHTLLFTAAPSVSLNPHVFTKLPYKASDLVPVIHVVEVPFVMIVRANSPFKSVDELVQAAKREPGKLNYATYGDGTPSHIAALQFVQKAGIAMTAIPYKDGGILSVMSGDVEFSMEASAAAIPQINGGKLRGLAVSANGRVPNLPGVPVLSEIYPGNQLHSWNGILAPRGTPPEALNRLSVALQKIVASSEFQQKALDLGLIPVGGTQAQFASFLAKDFEEWGAVVKRNNIRLD
ncbi:tripartite-type tricarboxylate transporter receptor subunit TctC [Variovorax beijingensis]|jgi:tripartite-type tricarboxylate transporter receptor subunit TctC|uniref:Tripartite-type tricarboxylate transporter receptor subunit TctC n=1 Tax=Variovorax beijingensis TaxID=2496117 RepID=A0A561BGN5_9BURK|nr:MULTISPECIES: tripartite tricarboxylate transporter substrate binding protein [Variovorax]MBD9663349.1 tripartite tricarboxylate transporter substrate binding protein [Variovorax sp. VRV01]TWD78034.1 tripartite-type tricarboxylate transporter receptor subunit TctC [Variovorax beijingensis]